MNEAKGRIADADLEDLRRKANIVDIAQQYMKVLKAGRLFKALCPFHSEKSPSFSIDPGKNLWHCLAGETGVLTKTGVQALGDMAGGSHELMSTSGVWIESEVRSFGVQQLWSLQLSRNGRKKTIYTTDQHRWLTRVRYGARTLERLTRDLRPGDALAYAYSQRGNLTSVPPAPFGVAHGFTFGDGTKTPYGSVAQFCGVKDTEMLKFFPEAEPWITTGNPRIGRLPKFFKDYPDLDEAPAYLYGWLAGYFAADGCVSTDGQVILSSASEENLVFVRTLANRLGVGTYGVKTQMRVGLGTQPSALHHLTFINSTLGPEFFVLAKHRDRFLNQAEKTRRERKGWVVESVESTDRVEEVYCAVVPGLHAFTLEDNILTGNCFGCGKGGDVITLVRELEQLDFVPAVELIARKAGVTLHYEQLSAADKAKFKTRNRLIDAHKEAMTFYHSMLMKSAEAKVARDYLAKRKLKPDTIERFQVGWAPNGWDALTKHLKQKGFKDEELTEGGLALRTERGGLIDRFRGRVMFPIADVTGEPRAFGGRILDDSKDEAKYINSAESPIYKKGTILYALDRAKADIVKADVAIIVEGYTDVIALHQEGIPLAVATCGTALGVEHFQQLSRFTRHVVISLDGDQAGMTAAERAVERAYLDAQGRDMDLRVLTLPAGSDPADFVTARGGDEFRSLLRGTVPVIEFRLASRLQGLDLSEPEGRARGLRACLPVLAQVSDQIVLRDYARWVADECGLDYDLVFMEVGKALRGAAPPGPSGLKRSSSQVAKEREAIKLALQFPELAAEYVGRLDPTDLSVKTHRMAWEMILQGETDPSRASDAAVAELLTRLSVEPVDGVPDGDPSDRLIEEIFTHLEEFALARQIAEVKARLEKLNPVADPEGYDKLFKDLVGLEAARRRMRPDDPAGA